MRREHPADYFMVVLAVFFCTLLMAGLVGCGGGDEDDLRGHPPTITKEEAR